MTYSQMVLRAITDESQRRQQIACAGGYGLVTWTGAPWGYEKYETVEAAKAAGKALAESVRCPVYVKSFKPSEAWKIHERC